MTIDQKLEILKRAMEMGAYVQFNIFANGRSKEESLKLGEELGLKFEAEINSWLDFGRLMDDLRATIYFEISKEDRKKQLLAELAELEKVE